MTFTKKILWTLFPLKTWLTVLNSGRQRPKYIWILIEISNFRFGKEVLLLSANANVMVLFILDRNLGFWHLNPGYSQWDQRKLLCFQYFYFLRLENTQFTVKLSAVFKLMVILSHVILRLLLWSWLKGKKWLRLH